MLSLSLASLTFESAKEKNHPVNHDKIPIYYNNSLSNRQVMHWWALFFDGIRLQKLLNFILRLSKLTKIVFDIP